MIVLDTHVLVWWLSEPTRLSTLAKRRIIAATAQALDATLISAHDKLRAAAPTATIW